MSQSTTSQETLFSPHASLAALAAQLQSRGIFEALRTGVHLAQKTVKDSPQDKLIDILMTVLWGAQSLVQINTLLRSDPALQRSIGRKRCCEQSLAQQTLDAATPETVEQMQQVLTTLLRQHSQAAAHPSRDGWLILDGDLTAMPGGKKAEKSVKGYFSQPRVRRGRQQGRGLASQDGEIVVDELYPGNTFLLTALPALIETAEQVLNLLPGKRKHTIIRLEAGEALNRLLSQGDAVVSKEYSASRASRQVGWVPEDTREDGRPVRRLAVRLKSRKGQWHSAVLLFAGVDHKDLLALLGEPAGSDEARIMRAYAHFYDQRGGGIETSCGEDKGGLGITKRNKRRNGS